MSVAVRPGASFDFDRPQRLLDLAPYYLNGPNYDVSLDGSRFVMVKLGAGPTARPSIVVVSNWIEEVKARVH